MNVFSTQLQDFDTPTRSVRAERLLVLAVLLLTGCAWILTIEDPVILHLYYIPVVITGFYLGQYQGRLMGLLSVLSATIVFAASIVDVPADALPFPLILAYLVWTGTLLLIAILVGKLSDRWRSALAKLRAEHAKDVLTDALTGVANRRAFEFELNRRILQWDREGAPLTLLMIDIDHFKKFNDRHGHPAGDAVLKGVAELLQEAVRKTDLVCRVGGEEFTVLLPGINFAEAQDVVERIRTLVETQRFRFGDLTFRVTISIGFAQVLQGESADSLTKRSDAALYSAKEAGRNRAFFHNGVTCEHLGSVDLPSIQLAAPDKKSRSQCDSYCDEMTGLPGQRVFLEELRRRIAEKNRYGIDVAIALARIDGFSQVLKSEPRTRTYMLATVASLLKSHLRETDLVARYGDDSFAILMPSTAVAGASIPLQRICSHARSYADPQYPGLSYALSIGAKAITAADNARQAVKRAELALMAASEVGGGCYRLYDQDKVQEPAIQLPHSAEYLAPVAANASTD